VERLGLEHRSRRHGRPLRILAQRCLGDGPSDIWAVGQNSGTSFIEHWNGQFWSHVASPAGEPPDGQLNAVSADSPADAWAAGSATNVNSLVTPLIEHWHRHATGTAAPDSIVSVPDRRQEAG
jgi:hypothetical protein